MTVAPVLQGCCEDETAFSRSTKNGAGTERCVSIRCHDQRMYYHCKMNLLCIGEGEGKGTNQGSRGFKENLIGLPSSPSTRVF